MHDHMNANNLHPHTLEIAAPLLFHLWSSCQRYQQHLDDQIKKNVTNGKQLKWKALDEKMDTVKKNKRKLVNTINELHIDADLYISQADSCSCLEEINSRLAKSTYFWKTAKGEEIANSNDNKEIRQKQGQHLMIIDFHNLQTIVFGNIFYHSPLIYAFFLFVLLLLLSMRRSVVFQYYLLFYVFITKLYKSCCLSKLH